MYDTIHTQTTDTLDKLRVNINNNDTIIKDVLKNTNIYKGFYNKLSYIDGLLYINNLKNITIDNAIIEHQPTVSFNTNYFAQITGNYSILDFVYYEYLNNVYKIAMVYDGAEIKVLLKINSTTPKIFTLKIDGYDINIFSGDVNNKYIYVKPNGNYIDINVYIVQNNILYLYVINSGVRFFTEFEYKDSVSDVNHNVISVNLKNNQISRITKHIGSGIINSRLFESIGNEIITKQYIRINTYSSFYSNSINDTMLYVVDIIDNKYYLSIKDSDNITTNIELNIYNDNISGSLFLLDIKYTSNTNKYEIIYSLNNNIYQLSIVNNQCLSPNYLFSIHDDIMDFYYYVDNNIINFVSKSNNYIINYNLITKNKICFTNSDDIYSDKNRVVIKIYDIDNNKTILMDYNISSGILLKCPSDFPVTKKTLFLYYDDSDLLKKCDLSTVYRYTSNNYIILSSIISTNGEYEYYQK